MEPEHSGWTCENVILRETMSPTFSPSFDVGDAGIAREGKICINAAKWTMSSRFWLCHSLLPKKQNYICITSGNLIYDFGLMYRICMCTSLSFFFLSFFLSVGADICWRWVVGGSPWEGGSPWRGRSVHRIFWAPGEKPQTTFILMSLTIREKFASIIWRPLTGPFLTVWLDLISKGGSS